jgi:DNA primase
MRIDYRELKQRIRLIDLLTKIGWKSTKGRGEQLRGPCPLPACCRQATDRNSRDADFSINTTRNIYQCFRCRSAGDVFNFWQTYRTTTFRLAAIELNQTSQTSNQTHT